ncbi:MAG: glycosyltransferase family 39 protein [Candidatus Hydrogenedentota bacterium]
MQNDLWMGGATALLAIATAVVLGDWLDHTFRSSSTLAERFLSGLLLLSCWTILLGTAGFLSRPAAALPLLIVPFIGAKSLSRNGSEAIRHLRRLLMESDRADLLLSGIISLSMAWTFLGALAPPSGMDALAYHLALPDQYLIRGSIIPDDLRGYSLFYQQFELALAPLLALDRSGISSNLLVFVIFQTLITGAYAIAHHIAGRRAGLLAAAAMATSPLAAILSVLTKNDLLAASLCAWSYHALCTSRHPVRIGLMVGAALAVKPTSAFAVLPILGCAVWRKPAGSIVPLLGSAFLFPLYWFVRNVILAGSPFDPGAPVQKMLIFLPPREALEFGLFAVRRFLESFFSHITADGTDGPYGILLMLLVANICLPGTREKGSAFRRAQTVGIIGWLLWLAAGRGQARFLLPLLAILGSTGAARAASGRRGAIAVLSASALLGLMMQLRILENENHFLDLHAGRISVGEYMKPWLNTYGLQTEADGKLPANAFIIAVGEAELFPLHRRNHYDGFWEPSRVLDLAHSSHSPEQLMAALQQRGYTHLLYNRTILQRLISHRRVPGPACENDFAVLHRMLAPLEIVAADTAADAFLYQLRPVQVRSPAIEE